MARIFNEGWECGTGRHTFGLDFGGVSANEGIETDVKSWGIGTYSYRWGVNASGLGGNVQFYKYLTTSTEWYIRFSHKFSNLTSTSLIMWFRLRDTSNNVIFSIYRIGSSNTNINALDVYKGNGATYLGSLGTLDGGWHTFEVHCRNATNDYVAQVKVDGSLIIDHASASHVGNANMNILMWNLNSGISNMQCKLDDVAVNDTSGSINNSWIGEGSVVAFVPNGNGDSSQFIGSDGNSTDNYLLVDERGYDSDTTYVRASESGATDLYQMATRTLTAGQSITTMQPTVVAREESATNLVVVPLIKSGTTTAESSAITYATTYGYGTGNLYETNPDTGLAWTQSDLDGVQMGMKITLP